MIILNEASNVIKSFCHPFKAQPSEGQGEEITRQILDGHQIRHRRHLGARGFEDWIGG